MMITIIEEEEEEEEDVDKQRKKAVTTLQVAHTTIQVQQTQYSNTKPKHEINPASKTNSSNVSSCKTRVKFSGNKATNTSSNTSVFQGAFCRDLVIVGNSLSQVVFNRLLPVKYEALSC
ncbi:hypothetical protein V6N13_127680 [Hibiscus sabdariffa]|uniref:Uncharacterized protein n=1 Tax=Hibiscus sabdariffa TaxID=183260 RepID=A0ABR2CDD0_9ROSI